VLRVLVLLLCGQIASACSHAQAPAPAPEPTLASLQAEAVVAPCTADTECRTVPVGARACGGPEAYLPWSVRAPGADEWRASVAAYTAASEQARVREGDVMSTCVMQEDPGARCAQGRCVLEGRSGLLLEQ
jgi:hypothetical protein